LGSAVKRPKREAGH